jgi:hypothetical protein
VAVERAPEPGERREFRQLAGVAGDRAGVVHHLGAPVDGAVGEQGGKVGVRQRRAGRGQVGRGHATRAHQHDAERQPRGRRGHEADGVDPRDVGDLVRVGDGGRDAVRHDGGRELRGRAEAALDVDVGVEEPGGDEAAAEVERAGGRVAGADAGDAVAVDRDVGLFDLAGEDVDDAGVGEQQVGRAVAAGDGEQVGIG